MASKPFKSFKTGKQSRLTESKDLKKAPAPPPDFDLAPLTSYPPEVFRSNEPPVDEFVLSLALAYNDLKSIEWVIQQMKRARRKAAIDAVTGQLLGMGIWGSRMTLGLIHELLKAIDVATKAGVLDNRAFTETVASIAPRARSAWSLLVAVATSADSREMTAKLRRYLVQVRNNAAFHYYQPTELHRGYKEHFFVRPRDEFNRSAFASIGENMERTRFYFADAAISRYYDSDANNELFKASTALRSPVNLALRSVVHAYLEYRKDRI